MLTCAACAGGRSKIRCLPLRELHPRPASYDSRDGTMWMLHGLFDVLMRLVEVIWSVIAGRTAREHLALGIA